MGKRHNDGGNSNFSGRSTKPVYKWLEQELIVRTKHDVRTPSGSVTQIICEVRRPTEEQVEASGRVAHRSQFRARVGRIDTRSFDGIGRQLWFDDLPAVIDALIDAYSQARPVADEIEADEIRRRATEQTERLKSRIKRDPTDWRNRLLDIEGERAELVDSLCTEIYEAAAAPQPEDPESASVDIDVSDAVSE